MRKLVTAAAMLALVGGVAHAQTASETTTSQSSTYAPGYAPAVPPPPPPGAMAPAPGTLSITKTEKATDGYGNSYNSESSTYRDANGVARDTRTTTTNVAPPPPPVSTTTTTTNTTTSQPQ